jgi:hypothetical protein
MFCGFEACPHHPERGQLKCLEAGEVIEFELKRPGGSNLFCSFLHYLNEY